MKTLLGGAATGYLALLVALVAIFLHSAQYAGDSIEFMLIVALARGFIAVLVGGLAALLAFAAITFRARGGVSGGSLFAVFGMATATVAFVMVVAALAAEVPRPLVYLFVGN